LTENPMGGDIEQVVVVILFLVFAVAAGIFKRWQEAKEAEARAMRRRTMEEQQTHLGESPERELHDRTASPVGTDQSGPAAEMKRHEMQERQRRERMIRAQEHPEEQAAQRAQAARRRAATVVIPAAIRIRRETEEEGGSHADRLVKDDTEQPPGMPQAPAVLQRLETGRGVSLAGILAAERPVLAKAVLLDEILGKPVALRPRSAPRFRS
jgi:hypothetical protein